MNRLTSPFYGTIKVVVTLLLVGGTVAVISTFSSMAPIEKLSIGIFPLLYLLAYFLILRNKSNVFEDGENLIIEERKQRHAIPFSDIASISHINLNPEMVTVYFKKKTALGEVIHFVSKVRLVPFKRDENIREFMDKVNKVLEGI